MPNDQLNEYFENAIREWAVEYFNEQMEAAAAREESESQEIINREILWHEKQSDIEHNNGTLLIKVPHPNGVVIWKVPARDSEFVKSILPVFSKKLPDLELPEAAELRRLKTKLSCDRWRLTPERRADLEKQIEDAEAALERAKARERIPRYGIFKTVEGRDVAVHRLYLRCDDDEKVSAFDGDMTNFCDVPLRYEVKRNFGLTEHQQKVVAPIYAESTVRNLYVISSDSNPSHGRMQGDFERDGIKPLNDPENTGSTSVRPNADLGARAGTPYGIQDAGSYRHPTAKEIEAGGIDALGQIDRHIPRPVSASLRRAGEALDRLLTGG